MDDFDSQIRGVTQILQKISGNVQKIKQLGQELENQNKMISVTGNSKAKSDLLNSKEKEAIRLIEATGVLLNELSSYTTLDHTAKIQAQLLKGDFQRTLQRFQRTQAEIKQRLINESRSNEPAVGDLIGLDVQGPGRTDDDQGLLFQSGLTQTQVQKGDAQELGFALQQEEEMQALEEDIVNVNIIFEQLMGLVYDQRSTVESIEDNIETAYVHQEAGTTTLMKAATSVQRSRRRRCICFVVLAVVLTITILVLIVVYTPRSKG